MRYKRQLEVRHYNIKQEIDSFILPPNTWYRDIGGKYSHVEIIVGLQSQYHLEKNETIEVAISCHYGSGYHEEITSDKPLYTILENLSRLKIDDSGSAIICLRFEQLSTRHSNEKFVIRISAKDRSDIESISAPPISVLSKPSETSRQRQNPAGILDSFKLKTGKRNRHLHEYPHKRIREDLLPTSYIYSDPTSLYHHHVNHHQLHHHQTNNFNHLHNNNLNNTTNGNNNNNNNNQHHSHNDENLLRIKSFHETFPPMTALSPIQLGSYIGINGDESFNIKVRGINDTTPVLDLPQVQLGSYKYDISDNPSGSTPTLTKSPSITTVINGNLNTDLKINLSAIPMVMKSSSSSTRSPISLSPTYASLSHYTSFAPTNPIVPMKLSKSYSYENIVPNINNTNTNTNNTNTITINNNNNNSNNNNDNNNNDNNDNDINNDINNRNTINTTTTTTTTTNNNNNINNKNTNINDNTLSPSCLLLQQDQQKLNFEESYETIEILPTNINHKVLQIQNLLKSIQWPIQNYIKKRDGTFTPHHNPVNPNNAIDEINRLSNEILESIKQSQTISPNISTFNYMSPKSPTSITSPPLSIIPTITNVSISTNIPTSPTTEPITLTIPSTKTNNILLPSSSSTSSTSTSLLSLSTIGGLNSLKEENLHRFEEEL